jgi:hypothetical protein
MHDKITQVAFLASKLWKNNSYVNKIVSKRVKIRYHPYYKYDTKI